tara:strand:- start:413 stop:589 length:177 start_codon:yes stop_codon:yes gene_type:complete
MFEVLVGMANWSPHDFWTSSPREVYMAMDGFLEFNGQKKESAPMTSDRLKELMELYPD